MKTKKTSQQLLSRRETLRLLGAAGATTLVGLGEKQVMGWGPTAPAGLITKAGSATGVVQSALFAASPLHTTKAVETLACVARPALTEGPYFVDERLNRSDIRTDPTTGTARPGAPFRLRFNVSRISNSACAPLAGAQVDIWHCDALGSYSDVSDPGFNTRGQKWLRGYQVTDANGNAEFLTIYPGWYSGRAVHIHFKIRLFSGATRTFEFTSQLFFDDNFTDQVYTQAPYNQKGARNTRNSNDGIYRGGGSQLVLAPIADGQGGYTADFDIGLTNVPATNTPIAAVTAVSAASFTAGALASNGIAALFGAGLAAGTQAAATQPLSTELGGVRVRVRDAVGAERDAPLFFVSPGQINFQVPPGTSAGSATITALLNNATVGQGTATIETVAPGLFTANASGQGVPTAVLLRVKTDGAQSYEPIAQFDGTSFVATPIDFGTASDQLYFVGYGTGFRYRSALSSASATIGGENAQVLFAGAQDGFAGLDQVNIALSQSLAGRGNVDLVLNVDGRASNTVSINIR